MGKHDADGRTSDGHGPWHARTPDPDSSPSGPATLPAPADLVATGLVGAPPADVDDPRPVGALPTQAGAPDDDASELVARTLDTLADDGWTLLHDLAWPDRSHAVIDHVAIGPAGIVVVASRHGALTSRLLRESGYGRSAAVERVAQAAAAITATLPPRHRSAVRAVLCTSTDHGPVVVQGVPAVGVERLVELLTVLPPRLSPFGVRDAVRLVVENAAAQTAPDDGPLQGRTPWWVRRAAPGAED